MDTKQIAIEFAKWVSNQKVLDDFWSMSEEAQDQAYNQFEKELLSGFKSKLIDGASKLVPRKYLDTRPKPEEFYNSSDPRGMSSIEHENYINALMEWKKRNLTRIIGREYNLDLGSSVPVKVKPIKLENGNVIVEYLNSTPGRRETFSLEDFSYFTALKIDSDGFISKKIENN